MTLAATSPAMATVLALLGLAVGPALAWVGRRLPGDTRPPPDPFRLRYALAAAAAAGIGLQSGATGPDLQSAALAVLLGWQLLLIALVDGEHYWLPDRLTLPLLTSGVIAAAVLDRTRIADALIGAAAGFAVLWLLARGYRAVRGREGLGGGDPFLLAGIGAWTGWSGLPGVLLWAALAGLSVVAGRAAAGRAVSGADRLPFGVFLAVGGWLTWTFGPIAL